MKPQQDDFLLWKLFTRLREWHFPLTPDDYQSLHDALNAGFGWQSLDKLRHLCCALWAKSCQEQEILLAEFDRLVENAEWEDWGSLLQQAQAQQETPVHDEQTTATSIASDATKTDTRRNATHDPDDQQNREGATEFQTSSETKGISTDSLLQEISHFEHQAHLILSPRYIVSYRQVAQAWRRLRRFVRQGPKTELDIDASIALRCHRGAITPLVLKARARNAVRLLLLIDRQGSMTPFHHFTDNAIQQAIYQSGRFQQAASFYFHDIPTGRRSQENTALLQKLSNHLFPDTDAVVSKIQPLKNAYVYTDTRQLHPQALDEALAQHGTGGTVVIVSDAGAARGNYDTARLVDSIACLKRLYQHTPHIIWLNPLPPQRWENNSAARIARHVPMFPVSREGLHQAVNVLRGQVYDVAYPL
ncbi:VWA domain-containing protein [Candidatus Venteria ishoeyi]|uniref:VWA domain containing CoxE-like protein n=1 Tax=Candidatus Venteria ishoeyi TaxID=1899563 RepID=A0A1H6FBC0_9GAMM|nr:VWA domain-containing protein [Candidatus Venteria ishoeyi]SEH06314.1 VWA domain containing CoxE-like protein [Candidatus Venteria ishoeyi]